MTRLVLVKGVVMAKRPNVSFCELRVNGGRRTSDWTLRELDGQWLIESYRAPGRRSGGAAFGSTIDQAVGFALDQHESWGDPDDGL